MPAWLVLRARQEILSGFGFILPAAEAERFAAAVPQHAWQRSTRITTRSPRTTIPSPHRRVPGARADDPGDGAPAITGPADLSTTASSVVRGHIAADQHHPFGVRHHPPPCVAVMACRTNPRSAGSDHRPARRM